MALTSNYDLLVQIDQALKDIILSKIGSTTINGMSYSMHNIDSLRKLRDFYYTEAMRERKGIRQRVRL